MNMDDQEESPWDDVPSSSKPTTPLPADNGDPLAKPQPAAASQTLKPSRTTDAPSKTPGGRGNRKKVVIPKAQLEAAEDPLAGPLGGKDVAPADEQDLPPELPQKEQRPSQVATPTSPPNLQAQSRPPFRAEEDEDSVSATQAQTAGTLGSPGPKPSQHSVSIEQAARPSFQISVGDPHKVGDFAGAHTAYQVRTRASAHMRNVKIISKADSILKTSSKAYRNQEFEVSRRYRDFLWLYNQMHSNNPGIIVPPPPEKQAVGRFDTDFVESRRHALERMLNKICAHPILQHDIDFKLFLESETFNVDTKHRERKDVDVSESKGMFSSLNLSMGSATKFIEHDDWFLDRRVYLDTLEQQLRALLKSVDTAVTQRKALSESAADLSLSLNTLSQVELSPSLSGPLAGLSDVHLRIRDLYERQAVHDVLTFGIVVDEYIRLIGSIKKAFEQRQRSWQTYHNAETDLGKRRSALDKLLRQGRSQTDKMNQLQADVADAERRAHQMRLQFDDLGRGMRVELERFEKEKVEDFRMGLETYLESTIEAQKELIELWETYLMHLDADEEEDLAIAKSHAHQPLSLRQADGDQQQQQEPPQQQPIASTDSSHVEAQQAEPARSQSGLSDS